MIGSYSKCKSLDIIQEPRQCESTWKGWLLGWKGFVFENCKAYYLGECHYFNWSTRLKLAPTIKVKDSKSFSEKKGVKNQLKRQNNNNNNNLH